MPLPEWDSWAQGPYLVEVARQCNFALYAAKELDLAVRSEGLSWRAWYAAQAFLTATANLSKLLDPVEPLPRKAGGKAERWRMRRGEELRAILEIPESSALLDRTVRNSFEHIDEKLDEWIVEQPRPSVEDYESGGVPRPPAQPSIPLRILDAERGVILFRDVELDVPAVVGEISLILGRVQQLESLSKFDPGLGAMLALLQPLPRELQLDAPTRRPDEPVTPGLPPTTLHSGTSAAGRH
jgi:hypothetical protein